MYSIFSKVGMRRGYPALTITFYSILSIAVILLPFAKWGDVAQYIMQNPLPHSGFMLADHMDAGKASILCSCEPVAAMVFGICFFGEIPTVLSITGLIIVLVALAMLVLPEKKTMQKNEKSD